MVITTKPLNAYTFQDQIPRLNVTYDLLEISHKMYMINSVSDEDIPNFLTPHSFIQTLRSTESLISTNERESYIVIGFRGTNEVLDIAVALFGHIAGPYGPSGNIQKEAGLVCSGFNRNLQYEVYEWMRKEIKMLIDTHPTYNIFFTGHSLGGSLSILSAAQLALDFPEKNITCVTFGAPRCTQNEFKMWTRREIPNCSIWNIVHGADPVARVPASWRGYTHAGHLIQLEEDGATAYFQNTGDHIYEGIPSEWNGGYLVFF